MNEYGTIILTKSTRVSLEMQLVDECDVIKTVFEACPQIVTLPRLTSDFAGFLFSINSDILTTLECYEPFNSIIQKNYIEVCEDGSFNYEYGDICGTHNCLCKIGYVPRTPENEELETFPWDFF